MDPDELYTLRAQYWLGHYTLCLEEAKSIARRPMAANLKLEREEFALRAYLGRGEYDKVIRDTQNSDRSALKVLGLHATYESAFASGDTASLKKTIDTLKTMASDSESANCSSFQLYASQLFLQHGLIREALECVHLGMTMEHLAISLAIYIKIDRLDLAEGQLQLMKQADEDSVLTQLSSARYGIATGKSVIDEVIHSLSSLSEQYGPSVMLLNVVAVAHLVAGSFDLAEAALVEAATEDGKDADTLINTVVCYMQMGKGMKAAAPVLEKLKILHKNHSFVIGLERVESAFERESIKYGVKA